jgi:hypothetical protein
MHHHLSAQQPGSHGTLGPHPTFATSLLQSMVTAFFNTWLLHPAPFSLVHTRAAEFQDLVDEVCMHAAASGSLVGMSGRVLLVSAKRTPGVLTPVITCHQQCDDNHMSVHQLVGTMLDWTDVSSCCSITSCFTGREHKVGSSHFVLPCHSYTTRVAMSWLSPS